MTTKLYLLLICLCVCSITFGQIVKLKVNNPLFRVGQESEIGFNFVSDTIESSNHADILSLTDISSWDNNFMAEGSLKVKRIFEKSGKCFIGPFAFTIDGKTYTSNKVEITVDAALPNVTDGVWINQVNFNGEDYLVIEQRINGEWKTERKANELTTSLSPATIEFAEINNETIPKDLGIDFNFSQTGIQTVSKEETSEKSTVHYKVSVYKLLKKETYNGKFVLTKKNFKNIPENIKVSDIRVK